jgi:D-serine deaminase-like pyridoxal phosphate-dependent protein
LIVDAGVVQRNLARMDEYAQRHDLWVRPHTKTHKSELLGRMQMEAGAVGLTVAKVGEAEIMARATGDLLLAYPAVDPPRVKRLAELANHVTVRVGIDSRAAADALAAAARAAASTLGILVDIDVGMHRTGVQTPEQALALAQYVDHAAGLRLDGVMFYPGHIWSPLDRQEAALAAVADRLAAALDVWDEHGLEAGIISGGSTPTAFNSHLLPELTEIRPGTYVYNDINTVRGGFCSLDDCAARIVCTVVSDAVPGQVVIDGGSKTFTSDRCVADPDGGHGYVVEYPAAKITKLSEEHGQVDVTRCAKPPKIGERVSIIPNHICPCVNLQDRYYWREGDEVRPMPVDARGRLS